MLEQFDCIENVMFHSFPGFSCRTIFLAATTNTNGHIFQVQGLSDFIYASKKYFLKSFLSMLRKWNRWRSGPNKVGKLDPKCIQKKSTLPQRLLRKCYFILGKHKFEYVMLFTECIFRCNLSNCWQCSRSSELSTQTRLSSFQDDDAGWKKKSAYYLIKKCARK